MSNSMDAALVLWPVLVQIILTISVFPVLGVRKARAIKRGGIDREKTALDNAAWPDDVLKVSNNIQNQFQTPILFYVLVMAFVVTNAVTGTVVLLAWLYAISRVVHAYIHTGSNYVPARFRVFVFGLVVLLVMAAVLATQLISISV